MADRSTTDPCGNNSSVISQQISRFCLDRIALQLNQHP